MATDTRESATASPTQPVFAASGDPAYDRYEAIFGDLEAPFAYCDLDAVWSNADEMLGRAGGKPIRVASKSVRCRPLLERVLAKDGFAGVMSFTLAESLGGVESLIELPAAMTHMSVAGSPLEVDAALVRLSVGIEDVGDLIADLAQALDRA